MTFTSNIFLIGILPWYIALSILLRGHEKARVALLLLANSIFYVWGGVGAFAFICVFSLLVWIFSLAISMKKSSVLLFVGIAVTVAPLIFVKYTAFIIGNINTACHLSISSPEIIVPAGISFYTFEAVSLLCDVYKARITENISLLKVYLYLTFFPTVTSGPIIRFSNFAEGLALRDVVIDYNAAIERVIIGLCKKVLVADKIAVLADYYFSAAAAGASCSVPGLWAGSIAYSLQLYFDFSGYSDMAIGIGQLLGFTMPENFDKPYQASGISDFWRRWHISLSQWFRDYIYIPLGGSRCSIPRHIFNLLVVWLLTGIWHGADWSFVIWGLGYFVLLTVEKYIPTVKKLSGTWAGRVYTLFFVNLLWIPFRAANLQVANAYILGMFGMGIGGGRIEEIAVQLLPYLFAAGILCAPVEKLFFRLKEEKWLTAARGAAILVLGIWAICAVVNSAYTPYIYGKF